MSADSSADAAGRRVLMLVQSTVAGDSRVLREAGALASAGYAVHVIGRGVPEGFQGPDGVSVGSVGRSGGLRPGGAPGSRPGPAALRPAVDAARRLLQPEHRARVERAGRAGAAERVRTHVAAAGAPDVVHAHDFNTLELAADVARRTGAALVYDSHEYWRGRAARRSPGAPGRCCGRRPRGARRARAGARRCRR